MKFILNFFNNFYAIKIRQNKIIKKIVLLILLLFFIIFFAYLKISNELVVFGLNSKIYKEKVEFKIVKVSENSKVSIFYSFESLSGLNSSKAIVKNEKIMINNSDKVVIIKGVENQIVKVNLEILVHNKNWFDNHEKFEFYINNKIPPNIEFFKPIIIAHALGSINKKIYTNSLEGFTNAINDGNIFFEADISLTKDNSVVAFHDDDMEDKFGISGSVNSITLQKFKNQKYYNKYTPLGVEDILKIMEENSNIYVILDIKKKINKNFIKKNEEEYVDKIVLNKIVEKARENNNENVLNRIIPQVHDYNIFDVYDVYDFPYKIWKDGHGENDLSNAKLHSINLYSHGYCDEEKLVSLFFNAELNNVKIIFYTVNNVDFIVKLFSLGAYGFYTDLKSSEISFKIKDVNN